MSPALQTAVNILSLNRGMRTPQSPATRVVEPASGVAPARGQGNLYILLELDGPEQGRARLYRELLNTIQQTYYAHRQDAPTALTAALTAAHSSIGQYNQYHNVHFRGGATCLVATGGEIISAQAGPTILAVRSAAGLQWFSPLNDERSQPLGGAVAPAVQIGRVAGHPDIVIVAMNSAWATYLEVPLMLEATAVANAQAVGDQLAGIGILAPEELTLLIVTLTPAAAVAPPPLAPVDARRARPAPAAPPDLAPAPVAPDGEEDADWEDVEPAAEQPAAPRAGLSAARGSLGKIARSLRAGLQTTPAPAGSTGQAPARAAKPAPARGARPARARSAQPARRIPYALAIAGLLLLLIFAITAGMWYAQSRQRQQLFQEYVQGAAAQYEAASAAADENQARIYLQAAREQLNEAERFAPEHADVVQWRNRIAELEARVNHVQPILAGFDAPLLSFTPGSDRPRQLFVNGLSLYVLDDAQGALTRYQLDENSGDRLAANVAPQVLIRTGADVDGRRVGELAAAVWAPASGNRTASGPLVLDRSNQLFGFADDLGAFNVTLAPNPNIGFIAGMYFYAGNLYLLDTGASQLWRYRPSGENYTFDPEPYFSAETSVNLSPVIDVAIDGAIWLLHPNGSILKFFQGRQEAFALDVVAPPLGDAVTLWANEADMPDGKLFIADGASNRILAFDKQGALLSQLMPADHPGVLNGLRSISIDEAANYLYVLTPAALYQIPIPPLAR